MRDAVGNDLKVGDLVALSLDRPLIFGRVVSLEEGGMIVAMKGGNKPEVRPSRVVVTSNHTIDADPRAPLVGSLLCLREDHAPPPETIEGEQAAENLPN